MVVNIILGEGRDCSHQTNTAKGTGSYHTSGWIRIFTGEKGIFVLVTIKPILHHIFWFLNVSDLRIVEAGLGSWKMRRLYQKKFRSCFIGLQKELKERKVVDRLLSEL